MKYQFDNPPTRVGIVNEFGINPERIHNIEVFIQSVTPSDCEFDSSKEQFSMVEAAFILKKLNLVEAFALLCSLPWNDWAWLVTLPDFHLPNGVTEPLEIGACFDKSGKLLGWKVEKIPCVFSRPWIVETRSPAALIADTGWFATHYEEAESVEAYMERFKYSTAVAAVSTCPLSETQWRRKFVAEGWYDPGRQISTRLNGDDALAASWNSFVSGPTEALAALCQFEKWAASRDSWDSLPKF